MDEHMRKMKAIANNLHEIPANEQCIGNLLIAIQSFMKEAIDELEKIHKVIGL